MKSGWQKLNQIVSLLLVASVLQVTVLAGGTASAEAAPLMGSLLLSGNSSVTLNGFAAVTGTTIFSGAHIVTPGETGATVRLPSLGVVEIQPASSVTVSFDRQNVAVDIASGHASLSTVEGVKGSVLGADGEPGPTNPPPGPPARRKGLTRAQIATLGAAGIAVIVITTLLLTTRDDNNPSPLSSPR